MLSRPARWLPAFALVALCGCAREASVAALLAADSGGATTAFDLSRKAFSKPAANLDSSQQAEFFVGNAFFNSAWVTAPSSTSARDGLGPLFNARSCDSCHNNDGRGRPPADASERPVSLVIQFGAAAAGVSGGDPVYGGNLNPFAVSGVAAEGTVHIHCRELPGRFEDGERYTLLAPEYTFEELAYGALAATTRSRRAWHRQSSEPVCWKPFQRRKSSSAPILKTPTATAFPAGRIACATSRSIAS